jgi:hypothetical protein
LSFDETVLSAVQSFDRLRTNGSKGGGGLRVFSFVHVLRSQIVILKLVVASICKGWGQIATPLCIETKDDIRTLRLVKLKKPALRVITRKS